MSGMIGSRQGWKEAHYVACPAGISEIASTMVLAYYDSACDPIKLSILR